MSGPVFHVLELSELGEESHYDLRLGPLLFEAPLDQVKETLGERLEPVGAALTPADRRPRPLPLRVEILASRNDPTPRETGERMRRQVRQLLNNQLWLAGGLYLCWRPDGELDGWLRVGGGDLTETDPGLSFGEFELELTDVYLVGQPGSHRAARRLDLADRRTGLVARDTRGLILSTDFAEHPLPSAPLVLPGDVVSVTGARGRTPADSVAGPQVSGRRLYRAFSAVDGEVLSYLPDDAVLTDRRRRHVDLEDPGSVRAWRLLEGQDLPTPDGYTRERDADPTLYGFERVLGNPTGAAATTMLMVDNGLCRLMWLGSQPAQGLALERMDLQTGAYVRVARVLAGAGVRDARVVELTPERAVVEWRGGARSLRAVLQRGWWGPRLEGYDDDGGPARLEFAGVDGATLALGETQTPAWVHELVGTRNQLTNPSAETGTTTGWTPRSQNNDEGAFMSVEEGGDVVLETNLVPDPRLALPGGNHWTYSASGGATDLGSGRAEMPDAPGEYGFRVHVENPDASARTFGVVTRNASGERYPVKAGHVYSTYAEMYVADGNDDPARDWRARVYWYDNTVTLVGDQQVSVIPVEDTENGNRYTLKATFDAAPAGATSARLYFLTITGVAADVIDVYFTRFVFAEAASIDVFFDGDEAPEGLTSRWTGTAHASTSELLTQAPPAAHGDRVFKLTRDEDGGGASTIYVNQWVPASEGEVFSGAAELRSATIGRPARALIIFTDGAGVQVGSQVGGNVVASNPTTWQRSQVEGAVAPAGAARAYLRAEFHYVPEGESHYLDACVLVKGETAPPRSSVGPERVLLAQGTADDTTDTSPQFIAGSMVAVRRSRAVVAQLDLSGGLDAAELASLSLADARAVPTLVGA